MRGLLRFLLSLLLQNLLDLGQYTIGGEADPRQVPEGNGEEEDEDGTSDAEEHSRLVVSSAHHFNTGHVDRNADEHSDGGAHH